MRRAAKRDASEPVEWSFTLPPPMSLNHMFINRRSGGRAPSPAYQHWRKIADQHLLTQGPRRNFEGPVSVLIELGEGASSPQIDTDNTAKCYMDTLVRAAIIPDDNRKIVKDLRLTWAPGEETKVTIRALPEEGV